MDDLEQYERKGAAPDDDLAQFERVDRKPAMDPKDAPGWFQPGSKSEAAVRGFANTATLGFGDELSSMARSLASGEPYRDLVNEQRTLNANAAEENPWSAGLGGAAGALGSGMTLGRHAVMAAPGMLNKMAAAARGGMATGAVNGIGAAPTMADILQAASTGAAIGGVANAAMVPIGGVANKMFSPLSKMLNKSAPVSAATPKMGGITIGLSPKLPAASTTSTIIDQLTLPSVAALGNMSRVQATNEKINWQADPYNAAIDTAIAGGQGAIAGAALRNAPRMATNGVASLNNTVKTMTEGPNTLFGKPFLQKPSSNPFSTINNFIKQAKGSENAKVNELAKQAADATKGGDNTAARKAAMVLSETKEGRAISNSTNPVRDKSDINFTYLGD